MRSCVSCRRFPGSPPELCSGRTRQRHVAPAAPWDIHSPANRSARMERWSKLQHSGSEDRVRSVSRRNCRTDGEMNWWCACACTSTTLVESRCHGRSVVPECGRNLTKFADAARWRLLDVSVGCAHDANTDVRWQSVDRAHSPSPPPLKTVFASRAHAVRQACLFRSLGHLQRRFRPAQKLLWWSVMVAIASVMHTIDVGTRSAKFCAHRDAHA